jgi:hypothetical protein
MLGVPSGDLDHSSHADRLLRFGDSETWGAYEQGQWRLFVPPGADEDLGSLATLHESLHSELDRSTAYGMILHAYALVARNRPGDESRLRMLDRLIGRCRTTHEAFATTLSVFILGQGRDRHDLLNGYPNYARYYRIGRELASPFRSPYLRYHATVAALRFCMQSDLLGFLRDRGPVVFDLGEYRAIEYPDVRLQYVRQQVARGVWAQALETVRDRMPAFGDARAALVDGDDVPEAVAAFEEEYDALSRLLMVTFYDHLRATLASHGLSALSFDGHREFGKGFLENISREVPAGQVVGPLRWAEADAPEDALVVRDLESEQLLVTRSARPARLMLLADIPFSSWPDLTCGSGGDIHRFIVSRSPMDLLRQHVFPETNRQLLQRFSNSDGLFVRRRVTDDAGLVVEYYQIADATEFVRFVNASSAPVFSNVSLAVASDTSWAAQWFDILKTTICTFLCDVSPFGQIERWTAQDAFSIHHSAITFTADGDARYTVVAFRPDVGTFPICLAPCSPMVAKAITHYFRHLAGNRHRLQEDASFLHDRADAVQIVLSHLFREEHVFDFGQGTMSMEE